MPRMPSHERAHGLAIERATVADAPILARAAASLFEQTFGDDNTREDMAAYLAQAFTESRQRTELEDEHTLIWLARDTSNGAVVGYAHLRLDASPAKPTAARNGAEIARLYTDRGWHGRGLGAVLMGACITAARDAGADFLWLGVWERNARAIVFYEKHGFTAIGEQPFMLGTDRQRDVVMALDLTRSR